MSVNKGYYLYAIFPTTEKHDFGSIGIGGKGDNVYTLHCKDLAVAVSRASLKVYYPTKKNATAHQKVISTIMQHYDVLPISFGTCVESYEQVMDILSSIYDSALASLDKIKNKIEVGLRVFWTNESFLKEVGSHREVETLKSKMVSQFNHVNNYKQMLVIGEKIMHITNKLRNQYIEQIYEPLSRIAVDSVLKNPATEKMILNSTYLVSKDRENQFDQKVNDFYNFYNQKLQFKYTGPWPPYSFVSIKIPREG